MAVIRRRALFGDSGTDPYGSTQTPGMPAPWMTNYGRGDDTDPRPGPSDPTQPPGAPPTTAPPPTAPPTPPAPAAPPPAAPHTYNPLAGWDVGKLNDPTVTNTKYNFGRALQDYGGAYGRGNLQGLLDYYNQRYGGHASAKSGDSVDFGESYGPVDIFNGNGDTLQWYVPGQQTAGGGPGGGPGGGTSPGAGGLDDPGNVGQDPFSRLLAGGYAALLGTGGAGFSRPNTVAAIEGARMPYEIARKSQLANARADLASRGLLSEPGHAQGPEATAINQIETNLAPAYTGAIADRLGALDQLSLGQGRLFLDTLAGGTQRQGVLGDLAIRSLEQNRLFNQFLAQFGLDRDRTLYELQNGQNQTLLLLLQQWLTANGITAAGYIK